ncbi:MAG: Jag N-terminal domain-containing protein [Acidimicrobiaceae bacterium]|nr:Jag N-terminal domain-containing protein [Acidimicrobiaceae bacterium]
MEWVTITAATVEDATSLALDQLGVAGEDAEIEVVEEPKPGLFGRLRGEATVRARVRPTAVRDTSRRERGGERSARRTERPRSRSRSGERDAGAPTRAPRVRREERSDAEAGNDDDGRRRNDGPKVPVTTVRDAAAAFLEGLFAAAELPVKVESTISGDDIEMSVQGEQLTTFVGARGLTLTQLQDITRVVSQRRLGDHDTRLRIDVGGYRQRRKDALGRFATKVASDVIESGTPRILEPMNSADRKIVHDTLAMVDGVVTQSEGDDPFRRVVVSRAPGA